MKRRNPFDAPPDESARNERSAEAERALKHRIEQTRKRVLLGAWAIAVAAGVFAAIATVDAQLEHWGASFRVLGYLVVLPFVLVGHVAGEAIVRARLKTRVRPWAAAIAKQFEIPVEDLSYLIDFWEKRR